LHVEVRVPLDLDSVLDNKIALTVVFRIIVHILIFKVLNRGFGVLGFWGFGEIFGGKVFFSGG